MQVVILAAGLGSRLGKGMPKALVEVAGKTMLEYQIEWIKNFSPDRVIVVAGYHFEEMKSLCKERFPYVTVVENKRFKEQNLYSLLSAEKFFDNDTLIMNVDHIYPDSFAKRVQPGLSLIEKYAIFADTDRPLTDDDMKVYINSENLVEGISKKLTEWNAGYIGMTFIKKEFWSDYLKAAQKVGDTQKEKAVVEMVIQELVDRKIYPEIINSDNVKWYEIDTPEELVSAEEGLSRNKTYSINMILVTDNREIKFSAVNLDERWLRQVDRVKVDSTIKKDLLSVSDFFLKKKISVEKAIVVFTNSIIDEETIEFAAETVYPSLGKQDAVLFKNKKGFFPMIVLGGTSIKKISLALSEIKCEPTFKVIKDLLEKTDGITLKTEKIEKGFQYEVTDEKSVDEAQWEFLKYLQFRPGGIVAKYFNRPFSIRITRKIIKYGWITPNFITFFDFFLGLLALSFFLIPSYWGAVIGAILFHINSIIDGVDGEVARMRHTSSKFGANFDSFCDETLGALLYPAIGYWLSITGQGNYFFVFGIVTGLISYTYAMVNFHSRYVKNGVGFYYWWDLNKPVKVLSRKPTLGFYLKRLFWRDSIIFFLMFMAIFNVLDYFIIISLFPAIANGVLMFIHIFIKKAQW